MSDEAANAATNSVIAKFKAAKEAKAALENEMSTLSEKLSLLAKVLKNPKDYRFLSTQFDLTVGNPMKEGYHPERPVVRLQSTDLDFQHLIEMVTNYDKARADKSESAGRLRNMGLPITD